MPTVLRFLSYRVAIHTNDHQPCHVHVIGPAGEAEFWLACPEGPPVLRKYYGLQSRSLMLIRKRLEEHLPALCKEWSSIHGDF